MLILTRCYAREASNLSANIWGISLIGNYRMSIGTPDSHPDSFGLGVPPFGAKTVNKAAS